MDGLTYVRDVSWEDVFAVWRANEGSDPVWQQFAIQERGWDSWESWRAYQSSFLDAEHRAWQIYTISAPHVTIPTFRIGPFRGWQAHFEQKHTHTFADLVRVAPEWVMQNVGVQFRMRAFPEATQFIGIHSTLDDSIVLFEGHHRATAVTLASVSGRPISFAVPPTIALTQIDGDITALLDTLLDTKSNRPE